MGSLPAPALRPHGLRVSAVLEMSYQYKGALTIEQELAAAEEAKEAARERIQERRAQLRRLRNDRKQLQELAEYENHLEAEIHSLTVAAAPLPEPVHGGRRGLEAAAEEMRRFNRTRDSRQRMPAVAA